MLRAGACLGLAVLLAACSDDPWQPACTSDPVGNCWQFLGPSGTQITSVAVSGETIFAGTHDGILRFDARHGRWDRVGMAGKIVNSVTVLPSGQVWVTVRPIGTDTTLSVAYVSNNGGSTWQPSDDGVASSQGYYAAAFSLAYDPSTPSLLFLGQGIHVSTSTNGGQTWALTFGNPGLDRGPGIVALGVGPSGSQRVWAGGQDFLGLSLLLRSDNGGTSWTASNPTAVAEDVVTSVLPDPSNKATALIGTFGAVSRTTDSGTTWIPMLTTAKPGFVRAMQYRDTRLFAVSDEELGAPGVTALGLYLSPDRGITWDTLAVPAGIAGGWALAPRAQSMLIGTRSGVWEAVIP